MTAWNLWGAEIQWGAMDWMTEMLGVTDVERFVHDLAAIRDHFAERSE